MQSLKEIFRRKQHYQTSEQESLAKAIEQRDIERRKRIVREIGIALMAFIPIAVATAVAVVWAFNLVTGCPT